MDCFLRIWYWKYDPSQLQRLMLFAFGIDDLQQNENIFVGLFFVIKITGKVLFDINVANLGRSTFVGGLSSRSF